MLLKLRRALAILRSLVKYVVLPHNSLDRALQLISAHGEDFLPVVDDTAERHILGVIYHKDLVLAQNRVLLEARARDQGEN